jgi:hypothetical protein
MDDNLTDDKEFFKALLASIRFEDSSHLLGVSSKFQCIFPDGSRGPLRDVFKEAVADGGFTTEIHKHDSTLWQSEQALHRIEINNARKLVWFNFLTLRLAGVSDKKARNLSSAKNVRT